MRTLVMAGAATTAVLLAVAAALVMRRIIHGPNVLNRVVALDVMVSIVVCGLGLEAAVTKHSATLPILISLSLVGFVGSVSVARFVARGRDSSSADRGGTA
jgi:multicomponent Na+:H+ antiporter subunit F